MRFRGVWILILVLSCLSLGAAVSVFLSAGLFPLEDPGMGEEPRYHFAVILENTADFSAEAIRQGGLRASQEFGAVVEFNGPRFGNLDEQLSWLESALWQKVDGIAVQVSDEARFTPWINRAVAAGIPVVTLGSDAATSARTAFVGTSSFELGLLAAKMAVESSGGVATVALITADSGRGPSAASDLRLAGFLDGIRSHPGMVLGTTMESTLGIYSAEDVARSILFDHPETTLIVCNTPADTVGVAQTLVDFNRVGVVKVVGFGGQPEILGYLNKGVVAASVIVDSDNLGYQAVKALAISRDGGRVSTVLSPGVRVQVAP